MNELMDKSGPVKFLPYKLRGSANSSRMKTWLVEVGPLACIIACLWSKMVWFSLSLRNLWWAPEESIGDWIHSHPAMFTATLSILMLLFALALWLPRVWRYVTLLSFDFFLTSLIVADTMHVNYYGDVPSIMSLLNLPMVPAVLPTVTKLLKPVYVVYYLDIIAGGILLPSYLRACRTTRPVSLLKKIGLCGGMIVSGLFLAFPAARLVWQDPHGIFAYTSLQRDVCATIGLLPYHLADVVIHAVPLRQTVGELDRQRVGRFMAEQRARRVGVSTLFGVADRQNLIVISAESLQAFPLGLEVHGQPIAPRLSAFAEESLRFVNFHDQTHLGTTSDAEIASLQSLHPLPVGVVVERYVENDYHGLPAILSEHGYATLSAVGEPGWFWNMKEMHPRLGFQQSFFEDNYKIWERIGPWLADRDFFAQTLPILEAQEGPFMAYLLSSSSHPPFELPRKYHALNLGNLEGTQVGNYLHSIHYFDQAFGEFIDGLRASGLLNRSVIALYGDHQAFFGKSFRLADLLGFPKESNYHHWLVTKKVPFMVRLPYGKFSGESSVAGGHLDIAPTLLSLLGISDDRAVLLGEDLTLGEHAFVVFRDGSFTDGRHYFINRFGPLSNSTCYEFGSGRNIDCQALEGKRREAVERLEISDLMLRSNLIGALRDNASSTPLRDKDYSGTPRRSYREADTRRVKWQLIVREGNIGALVFPADEKDKVRIDISKAETTTPWDIQLNQPRLSVKKGHSYGLSFQGRADRPRRISFAVARAHGRWDNLGLYKDAELTTEWESFHADFVATAGDENARIHFDVGGNNAPVELKAVTLRSLPEGKLVEPPGLGPLSFEK